MTNNEREAFEKWAESVKWDFSAFDIWQAAKADSIVKINLPLNASVGDVVTISGGETGCKIHQNGVIKCIYCNQDIEKINYE
jgi:hypothetical protein